MDDAILIRRAETPADYRACQEAQRLSWGLADESYVVPVATMVGAQHHGGLVLGAFLSDGRAVGVSFAFLGKSDGRACLYSQLTGVVPGFQCLGLGLRLKHAQRDFCREQGLPRLVWAFDPMQAGNARFNLVKLGATCRRLIFDMYGPRTDALNGGSPTDRLIAEWSVDEAPRDQITTDDVMGLPRIIEEKKPDRPYSHAPEAGRVLLEIPADIAAKRAYEPERALFWQVVATNAMHVYFERGYRADGFARWLDDAGHARCGYVLTRCSQVVNNVPTVR